MATNMASNRDVGSQFDTIIQNADDYLSKHVLKYMESFGDNMINTILPSQAEFRNLTGNTLTSYAYGTYLNGVLQTISLFGGEPAIRLKLTIGEILRNFEDYDGDIRTYFKAEVDTNRSYGSESSYRFLANYKARGKYSMIFTTGTEYSAYLENVLNLNVLSDGFDATKDEFLNSFIPIA